MHGNHPNAPEVINDSDQKARSHLSGLCHVLKPSIRSRVQHVSDEVAHVRIESKVGAKLGFEQSSCFRLQSISVVPSTRFRFPPQASA